MQIPLFLVAAVSEGWLLLVVAIAYMAAVFGAIPFTDAIVLRYVDDRMRSRVSGIRIAVSFGVSSLAVWALGPIVKASGFQWLLLLMAAIAVVTLAFALLLPDASQTSPRQPGPQAA
jgi:MFS family permease